MVKVVLTDTFWSYTDLGTGSYNDCGILSPKAQEPGYCVGMVFNGNYNQLGDNTPKIWKLECPSNLVKPPIGWKLHWNDEGAGG